MQSRLKAAFSDCRTGQTDPNKPNGTHVFCLRSAFFALNLIVKSFELLYFHLRETCLHAIGISAVLLTFRFLSVIIICPIVMQKKLALELYKEENCGGAKKVRKFAVFKF